MARWSVLNSAAERFGNRALARVLGVSESTVRSARQGRAGRPTVQASSRATLERVSKGRGPIRLERALEADRSAGRGEKQFRSSVPRRASSKNAPRQVKMPAGMTGQATQIGKPGGHELYRSQIETLVAEMDAQIGPDRPWHVAIHGAGLFATEDGSDEGLEEVTRWYSEVKPGREVLEALQAARDQIAEDKRNLPTFLNPKDRIAAERSITAGFAREFAKALTGIEWVRVDALYIRPAKAFGQTGQTAS